MHQTSTGTKKTQKKQKFQQLLRSSGPIVPGNFSFFWCLCRFGASSGLFFFSVPVQVWWLWLHKTLTGTKKNTKNQKFQQLLRSGPIVPGNFSFLYFFWCLCRFGASSVFFLFFLVLVQVWCIYWFVCFFLMPVQVLVILDCVCLDLGHILNLCFKEANIPLSLNSYATTQVAWR